MRKIFLLAFLLAFTILVVSCIPPGTAGEKTAMAGFAFSKGVISKSCADADNDGYGARGRPISSCPGSRTAYDCDDTDRNVNPGTREVCGNRIDDNCNKRVDEAGCVAAPATILLPGVCSPAPEICDGVDNNCDGQVDNEICDTLDNNCDGQVDEGCSFCVDTDGDNPLIGGNVIERTSNGTIANTSDFCYNFYGDNMLDERICSGLVQSNRLVNCTMLNPNFRCIDPDRYSGGSVGGAPAYCGLVVNSSPTCGNGIIESGEVCDDGANNGDRKHCSACTCVDEDGNPTVASSGINLANGSWSRTSYSAVQDVCNQEIVPGQLAESYCEAGAIVRSWNTCPSGQAPTGVNCVINNVAETAHCAPCPASGCPTSTCTDSDSTDWPANPNPSYVTPGNVTTPSGTFADRCDPAGIDIFENICDGITRREIDFSCDALGAGYRCIDPDGAGLNPGYCGR